MGEGSSANKKTQGTRKRVPPEVRERAEELQASGFPVQMAWDVATGALDLNDALERLARQKTIDKLMRRHDLSKALASQVALGHADLAQVLFRKRLEVYREANQSKTCLEEGASLVLHCFGGLTRVGVAQSVDPYCVSWGEAEGDEFSEVHKLEIKFACAPQDATSVGTHMVLDKERSSQPQSPRKRPQHRYNCSDRRLFRFVDEQERVRVTLLEGEIFVGLVRWFSRYELELELQGGVGVVIFRHGLAALTAEEARGDR